MSAPDVWVCHRVEGAGQGAGEPAETGWSILGPLGYTLQYMVPAATAARQCRLEHAMQFLNESKLKNLPQLLVRFLLQARRAR